MSAKTVTILQHSTTVRPYALYSLMEKLEVEMKLCSFVPHLNTLGWTLPEDTSSLIILGGPQSVYEQSENPWLKDEFAFAKKCIDQGHPAFGICLGGQILSHILGAHVIKCEHPEVGWYPVRTTSHGQKIGLAEIEKHFFQWHFDGFELPKDAHPLFEGGTLWKNQGYIWKDQVLSVQFHPEMTHEGATLLREKYNVPDGTHLRNSVCLKSDFDLHGPHAHSDLERIISWFLSRSAI